MYPTPSRAHGFAVAALALLLPLGAVGAVLPVLSGGTPVAPLGGGAPARVRLRDAYDPATGAEILESLVSGNAHRFAASEDGRRAVLVGHCCGGFTSTVFDLDTGTVRRIVTYDHEQHGGPDGGDYAANVVLSADGSRFHLLGSSDSGPFTGFDVVLVAYTDAPTFGSTLPLP